MTAPPAGALPPLPEPDFLSGNCNIGESAYTAEQMREYALLAALRLREWRLIAKGGSLPAVGEWVSLLTDTHAGSRPDLLFLTPDKPRFAVFPAQLRFVDEEGWPTWQRWELASGSPCGRIEGDIAWQPLPAPPTADDLARVLEESATGDEAGSA